MRRAILTGKTARGRLIAAGFVILAILVVVVGIVFLNPADPPTLAPAAPIEVFRSPADGPRREAVSSSVAPDAAQRGRKHLLRCRPSWDVGVTPMELTLVVWGARTDAGPWTEVTQTTSNGIEWPMDLAFDHRGGLVKMEVRLDEQPVAEWPVRLENPSNRAVDGSWEHDVVVAWDDTSVIVGSIFADDRPAKGAVFEASRRDLITWGMTTEVRRDGRFLLILPAPGGGDLSLWASYRPCDLPYRSTAVSGTLVDIGRIDLQRGAALSGTVRRNGVPTGAYVVGARRPAAVADGDSDDETPGERTAKSASDGTWLIEGIAHGVWEVKVTGPDDRVTEDVLAATSRIVNAPAAAIDLDLRAAPLTVLVSDVNGRVHNWNLSLASGERSTVFRGPPVLAPDFLIDVVPGRLYQAVALHDAHLPWRGDIQVPAVIGGKLQIQMERLNAVELRVRLLGPAGTQWPQVVARLDALDDDLGPLPAEHAAIVSAWRDRGSADERSAGREDGFYVFKRIWLRPGRRLLRIVPARREAVAAFALEAATTVEWPDGGTLVVDVDSAIGGFLEVEAYSAAESDGRLAARIIDARGATVRVGFSGEFLVAEGFKAAPVTNLVSTPFHAAEGVPYIFCGGRARTSQPLPAGPYSLEVTTGNGTTTRSFEIVAGQRTSMVLSLP